MWLTQPGWVLLERVHANQGLLTIQLHLSLIKILQTSAPEVTINAVGSSLVGTNVTCVVKPTSAAVGASNPSYSFSAVVAEWQALSGAVGELATISATWPISGVITKAIA